jgi:hypothetical protein
MPIVCRKYLRRGVSKTHRDSSLALVGAVDGRITMRAEEQPEVEQTLQWTHPMTRRALDLKHEYLKLLNRELE